MAPKPSYLNNLVRRIAEHRRTASHIEQECKRTARHDTVRRAYYVGQLEAYDRILGEFTAHDAGLDYRGWEPADD